MDSARLATLIRTKRIDIDPQTSDFNQIAQILGEIEFETQSPSGEVAVWMLGNGRLSDVIITDEALDDRDEQQMAKLLTETISQAEETIHQAITDFIRREIQKGNA